MKPFEDFLKASEPARLAFAKSFSGSALVGDSPDWAKLLSELYLKSIDYTDMMLRQYHDWLAEPDRSGPS